MNFTTKSNVLAYLNAHKIPHQSKDSYSNLKRVASYHYDQQKRIFQSSDQSSLNEKSKLWCLIQMTQFDDLL